MTARVDHSIPSADLCLLVVFTDSVLLLLVSAPSAAPGTLRSLAGNSTATSVQVSWTPVNYLSLNGLLRAYSLQYIAKGGTTWTTVNVSSSVTSFTIVGLTHATEYTIRIAAESTGGVGVYSAGVKAATTQNGKYQ